MKAREGRTAVPQRQPRDDATRDRLLKAAERLFADRGFRKVTVREICRAAHANVAAVNYHFGDKLGLYREVLQAAIDVMRATTDAAREAGAGQPAEEQLRRSIAIFVQRLLGSGHDSVHKLIHREMHDPTPALDAIVEQGIRPRIEYLSTLVAEILRCPVVRSAGAAVRRQHPRAVARLLPNPIASRLGFPFTPTSARLDEVAEHIAEFSLGRHPRRRASRACPLTPPTSVCARTFIRQTGSIPSREAAITSSSSAAARPGWSARWARPGSARGSRSSSGRCSAATAW